MQKGVPNVARTADRLIGGMALLIAFAFVAWMVRYWQFNMPAMAILLQLWVAGPYVPLAIVAFLLSSNWASRIVLTITIVGIAIFDLWTFSYVDTDAQGGLLFVFIPAYQTGAALIAIGIVVVVELIHRRRREHGE